MVPETILQIRVALVGIDPPIWRLIQIPSSYSFWDLHVAIQDAMGWTDSHLHVFRVPDPRTGTVVEIGIPVEGLENERPLRPGWDVCVRDYLFEASPLVTYEYDFGDSWIHAIQVELELRHAADRAHPVCVAGGRKCPPEDCGGIPGYEEFLRVIADATDPEHQSMLEWAGGSFDPEAFDPSEVSFDDPRERWRLAFGTGA
ncbi:MAG: plasmid pRiA4b ORF-3 family protein [Candidatus Krumholzibacteriia bacterium]